MQEEIRDTDTADDLLTRLAYSGAELLVQTMDSLADGSAVPCAQEGEATHVGKITTADARIDWSAPAQVVDRHIRAVTPGPGAWTMLGEQRIKLGPVTPAETADLAPGEVRVEKNRVLAGTGDGDVVLGGLQSPGKKMMAAADWGRGLQETEGLVMA